MKQFLKIQSSGEIEIEAFTLIGASSKRGDETKIGYYGSGLKYSIASMLRNGIEFKIFRGKNEIIFDVVEKDFRSEKYSAISVNGKETSLTTTMGGKDWDIAFAPIREIYSNALDEDESALLESTYDCIGCTGTTTFYIEKTEEVKHFYENFTQYFCDKNPNVLASNKYVSIYPKTDDGGIRLFRKGILCYHNKREQSLFSYNSPDFQINESRVLTANYSAKVIIARGWKMVQNKALIKELLNGMQGGNSGRYEHGFDFSYDQFSNEWFEVCKNMRFVPAEMLTFCKPKDLDGRMILPKSLLLPLFRQFDSLDILGMTDKKGGADFIIEDEPSEILVNKVIDALAILQSSRYKHRIQNIDIVYAVFVAENVRGLASDGKIILSTKLDSEDVPYIAKIIIEENEHNRSGFGDETRDFQNHLFKLYYDQLTCA